MSKLRRFALLLFISLALCACGKKLGVQGQNTELGGGNPAFGAEGGTGSTNPGGAAIVTPTPGPVTSVVPNPTLPPNQSTIVQQPPPAGLPPFTPVVSLDGKPIVPVDQNGNPVGQPSSPLSLSIVVPNYPTFTILTANASPGGGCSVQGNTVSCTFPAPGKYELNIVAAAQGAVSVAKVTGVEVFATPATPLQGLYGGTCITHYKDARPGTVNLQMTVSTSGVVRVLSGITPAAFMGGNDLVGNLFGAFADLRGGYWPAQPAGTTLELDFAGGGPTPAQAIGSGGGISDRNYFYECRFIQQAPYFR